MYSSWREEMRRHVLSQLPQERSMREDGTVGGNAAEASATATVITRIAAGKVYHVPRPASRSCVGDRCDPTPDALSPPTAARALLTHSPWPTGGSSPMHSPWPMSESSPTHSPWPTGGSSPTHSLWPTGSLSPIPSSAQESPAVGRISHDPALIAPSWAGTDSAFDFAEEKLREAVFVVTATITPASVPPAYAEEVLELVDGEVQHPLAPHCLLHAPVSSAPPSRCLLARSAGMCFVAAPPPANRGCGCVRSCCRCSARPTRRALWQPRVWMAAPAWCQSATSATYRPIQACCASSSGSRLRWAHCNI